MSADRSPPADLSSTLAAILAAGLTPGAIHVSADGSFTVQIAQAAPAAVSPGPCPTDEVLDEPQAAEFLKKSTRTLQRLRERREIPHLPGKPTTYLRASLLEWLKGNEIPVDQKAGSQVQPEIALATPPAARDPREKSASTKKALLEICLAA